MEEGWSQVQPGPLCGHSGGTLAVMFGLLNGSDLPSSSPFPFHFLFLIILGEKIQPSSGSLASEAETGAECHMEEANVHFVQCPSSGVSLKAAPSQREM